jgi:hypothetical protein
MTSPRKATPWHEHEEEMMTFTRRKIFDGRSCHRALATGMLAAAVWLSAATAAHAQAVATATPNASGKASRLHWAIDGNMAPVNGLIPSSLKFSAPRGFTLNPKAVAKRCTSLQAKLDECPRRSRIGSAVMTIHVDKPSGPRDLPIKIKLYLGRKNNLLAVAFLAGVRVVPGSISGLNGITVTFDPLPTPPAIPQVSYRFLGVSLNLGTHRSVIRRMHGRRKRIRIDLVQNPRECASGGWPFSSTVGLPDGTTLGLASPVTCTGS